MTPEDRELYDKLEAKIDAIAIQLARQKGFVGGVIFTVSALWAVGLFAFSYFKGH